MADAQTLYDLRKALERPGCPVCRVVRRSGAKYMEGLFYESVLDPGARRRMVESMGFCYEHAWMIADLKLSDALGQAIVYQDILGEILKKLIRGGEAAGEQLAKSLGAEAACPACGLEAEVLERIVDCLPTAIQDHDFTAVYESSSGMCLPHLRRALPELNAKEAAVLVGPRKAQLDALKADLAEFIRKNDYRFKDEPMGAEGDSHLRAAAWLVGEPRPFKKADLV